MQIPVRAGAKPEQQVIVKVGLVVEPAPLAEMMAERTAVAGVLESVGPGEGRIERLVRIPSFFRRAILTGEGGILAATKGAIFTSAIRCRHVKRLNSGIQFSSKMLTEECYKLLSLPITRYQRQNSISPVIGI